MITILLVDDDFSNRSILREGLGREYQYLEAWNGEEGLRLTFEKNVDLVITDMQMPRMNGDEMIKKIRERRPWVKIIAVSASHAWKLPEDVELFIKPFKISEIKDKVKDLLRGIL